MSQSVLTVTKIGLNMASFGLIKAGKGLKKADLNLFFTIRLLNDLKFTYAS